MGTSATKAKNKYNSKNYKRFQTSIKKDLFERIDKYRKENNLSYSEFLKLAIDNLENK